MRAHAKGTRNLSPRIVLTAYLGILLSYPFVMRPGGVRISVLPLRGGDPIDDLLVLLDSPVDFHLGAGAEFVEGFDHLQNPRLEVFVERPPFGSSNFAFIFSFRPVSPPIREVPENAATGRR